MSLTAEFLNYYLTDFENCVDTEKLELLKTAGSELVTCSDNWKDLIELNFDETKLKVFFKELDEEKRTHYFTFGVACITHFVQKNFTGPNFEAEIGKFLSSELFAQVEFAKLLTVNNEDINLNTEFPQLLVAAKAVFNCCHFNEAVNLWWNWRATLVHQQVLDELSPALLSSADRLEKELIKLPLTGNAKAKLEIELAQLYVLYRNVTKASSHLTIASDILGVKYEMTGRLGIRTRHQKKETAQLALEVTLLEKDDIERVPVNDFAVPKNLELKDDIRLETVNYSDNTECKYMFPDTEQKLLLLIIQEMLGSKPRDDLFYEEIEPFINLILGQKNTWTVSVATLLLRCKLESKHNRTIERSLQQCEEILNGIRREQPHPLNRVGGVYSTGLQPVWRTFAQYADLILNTGLVKTSLEIYLRLQLWEEVIVCYTILKMRHKAAEIIKQELDKKETVKLWCLLGDATDDVSCYEKAWELSKKRSHRAQRHWGQYYFSRKQYAECIPHFEKSVSINPLQAVVWLRLGFAALETGKWQVAATAYRRYTTLEPEGFEAWNNLAQAYLKLNNRRGAHLALTDALRCNFENWKIWENLLVVSAEMIHFADMLRAYHRLLDLKGKYLNIDVLGLLAYGVANNAVDYEGKPTRHLMQKTRELLGRVASIYPGEGHVWELYAVVAPVLSLKAQRFQRAFKCYTQGDWAKDVERCRQVLFICHKLSDIALDESIEPHDLLINSIRLNISSALAAIRKYDWEDTRDFVNKVAKMLEDILVKFNKGKAASAVENK